MQIISTNDIIAAGKYAIEGYTEMSNLLATAIFDHLLLSFKDFSAIALISAIGAAIMLWHNKTWIVSGIINKLGLGDV